MANIKTTAVTTTVVIKAVLFSGAAQASLRGPVSFQDYVVSGYFADDYIGVRQAYEVPAALVKYILLRADSSLDLRGLNFGVHDSTIVLDQTQFDLFKGLADALVLVDSAAINTGPGVADAVAATDSFERTVQFARLLADVSAITDSFAASTDKPFASPLPPPTLSPRARSRLCSTALAQRMPGRCQQAKGLPIAPPSLTAPPGVLPRAWPTPLLQPMQAW